MSILKFVAHSRFVQSLAFRHGWLPAARYTNLRDVRSFERLGFLDIEWTNYNYKNHLFAARSMKPLITVARDIEYRKQLPYVLEQADELALYARYVIIVPKDPSMADCLPDIIPDRYLLGYSVPSKYGSTSLPLKSFFGRAIHLLGGRPDTQRNIANILNVVSLDCNRFTLDARYGDFFDGERFRPHPLGGYDRCLSDSMTNIESIWKSYKVYKPLEM